VTIPLNVVRIGFGAFSSHQMLTIYVEATTVPTDWNQNCELSWNDNVKVVWDYKNQ
jgi:hypothetical protein